MKKSKLMILIFFLTMIFSCQREKNPVTPPIAGKVHPQVDIPWPSLANSPWPMFHHDPQSTGRSPYRGPRKGKIKWTFKPGGTIYSAVVIGTDGTIYFPVTNWDHADSSGLYALSPNGKLKWWFPIPLVSEVQPLIAADGTIFIVGGRYLHLYAINPDGSLKNEFNFSFELSTRMSIGKDGVLYFTADNTDKGELYAVSQDGNIIWKMMPPHFFGFQNIPISPDGGTLYLFDKMKGTNIISSLCAIGTDGQLKWSYFLGGKQRTYSSPLIDSDGNIYFGTIFLNSGITGYGFYALSPQGKLRWKFPGISSLEPTMDSNGNLVFNNGGSGNLISVDFMGDLRWQKENREYSQSSLISDRDGSIYLASYYWPSLCHITAYDNNGNVRWKVPFDGNVTRVACPAIGRDGTLYVGTFAGKDSKLYAIE